MLVCFARSRVHVSLLRTGETYELWRGMLRCHCLSRHGRCWRPCNNTYHCRSPLCPLPDKCTQTQPTACQKVRTPRPVLQPPAGPFSEAQMPLMIRTSNCSYDLMLLISFVPCYSLIFRYTQWFLWRFFIYIFDFDSLLILFIFLLRFWNSFLFLQTLVACCLFSDHFSTWYLISRHIWCLIIRRKVWLEIHKH